MRLTIFACVILLLGLLLVPAQSVQACSGGSSKMPSLETIINDAELFVKASVLETDGAHINVILEADTYLKGGRGPEHLLLQQASPIAISARYGHAVPIGCDYGPPRLSEGTVAYFALNRNLDGSYRYTYSDSTGRSSYLVPYRLGYDPRYTIGDEDEFIATVTAAARQEPMLPSPSSRPLLTPLLITTDAGKQYIFPIDRGELAPLASPEVVESAWSPIAYPALLQSPPACAAVGCWLRSPDQGLFAVLWREDHIHYEYGEYTPYGGQSSTPEDIEGQAFAFSPTGEALLVWNDNLLEVYLVSGRQPYYLRDFEISTYLDRIARVKLNDSAAVSPQTFYGKAMWSADGTTITYAAADGVYSFDLFRQNAPVRIAEPENGRTPEPLYTSSTGRFVAYSFDHGSQQWITLDRMTGEKYENGIVSPDERYMALIVPSNTVSDAEFDGCGVPLMVDCRVVLVDAPRYFQWIDGDTYFTVSCNGDGSADCVLEGNTITFREARTRDEEHPVFPYEGYLGDVTFEPLQQALALVTGPQSIRLESLRGMRMWSDEHNLAETIEGNITDISWMPALFYHGPVILSGY